MRNEGAKEKRHRIKQHEREFLFQKKFVKINSHDLIAWKLFAKLRKAMKTSPSLDIVEELRKIAVQVDVDMRMTVDTHTDRDNIYLYNYTGRSWHAVDNKTI